MINYLLQQEAKAKMKSLPQKALLHFTLLSIIIAFCPWTVHRFYLKKIFPDFNVAKKFGSGRTMTEKVVTSVLAQYSIDPVLKSYENDIAYFGVATDGTYHNELKLFPIIIQYFDWRKGGLQSKLIEFTSQTRLPTQLPLM